MVFAEQGVAMLSSVLQSERAIEVNIAIMQAFVQIREMLTTHVDRFRLVFEAIRQLQAEEEKPRHRLGF